MSRHDHHTCDHEMGYCKECDVAYCRKCSKEWGGRTTWLRSPYHYTSPTIGGTEITCGTGYATTGDIGHATSTAVGHSH